MSGYAAGHGGAEEWNPDLFYRLKLKLWNRDHMTNAVRTPWDRPPPTGADNAHWQMGTRVVVTEDGDMHSGKTGRVVEYRGKGLYAVLMEDGHKVTFSPLQWERTADQRVRAPPPPLPVDAYRSAAHHALEAVEGRHYARDGSPAHYATPGSFGRGASYGNLSARGSKGGSGDVEMTPSAASQSNPPPGTRVRIVRTYGGQLLPKDEVRTGETHQFAHGWYYITLDDSGKKESFVVVGDEEDIELGFSEGAADAARSSRKAAYESSLFGRDAGEGGARNKDAEEDAPKEPVRTYTGKKRGRKPKERVEESESDDDDSDDEDTRKKGKKSKENKDSREEEEARIKREKEEARRRRERELEEREQEKERERERERERLREEEAKAEANMTQEERDALEAARLAAMLNRNPRRRGGGDGPAPGMQVLPRIPIKKKKEKKEDDASKS